MRKTAKKTPMGAADVGGRAAAILAPVGGEQLSKKDRLARGQKDFPWFCRYYLPDYFMNEAAPFHQELSEMIDTQPRVALAAPREHAKSTTVTFAKVLQQVLYKLRRFIVIFRATDPEAAQNINDLREELESNERIREDFGDLVGQDKWSESEFITNHGVKVAGRGRGVSVRGLRYKQFRPDLVILDDIEDDEQVESKQRRDKLHNWLRKSVSNLVSRFGAIFMVGTVLHHDSLLSRILKTPGRYTTKVYRAYRDDGTSLWPAQWPKERLEEKRLEIGSRAFATEFMNDPANEEDQIFQSNWWRRFSDDDIAGLKLNLVAAIDPAIGLKQKNDKTAVAVVGEREGRYYILRMRMKKLKVLQQVQLVLSTCREFPGITRFGFETIAYQDALKQIVQEQSRAENVQVPAVAAEDISTDKIRRIGRLAPLAEQGLLYFPSAGSAYWSPEVEECLEEFEALGVSANSHDDGPDAVERAISLLRGQGSGKVKVRLL